MEDRHIDIYARLVDRCKSGDSRAQAELYQVFARSMYNVSRRIVGNDADAEDVLQESFVDAYRKLKNFRGESTFGAWLKRIVVNRSISSLRKRRLELFEEVPDTPITEEPHQDFDHDVHRIKAAIRELPDGYRVVLTLYLLEGYDHQEIAGILKISESTSKTQYNRAKNKVREILKVKSYAG